MNILFLCLFCSFLFSFLKLLKVILRNTNYITQNTNYISKQTSRNCSRETLAALRRVFITLMVEYSLWKWTWQQISKHEKVQTEQSRVMRRRDIVATKIQNIQTNSSFVAGAHYHYGLLLRGYTRLWQ